jgi:hypothetical protein
MPFVVRIYAELASGGQLTGVFNDLSRRAWTRSSIVWSLPSTASQRGSKLTSPDLTSLFQEVAGNPSWQAGDSITLLFSPVVGNVVRFFANQNGDENRTRLNVWHSSSNASSDQLTGVQLLSMEEQCTDATNISIARRPQLGGKASTILLNHTAIELVEGAAEGNVSIAAILNCRACTPVIIYASIERDARQFLSVNPSSVVIPSSEWMVPQIFNFSVIGTTSLSFHYVCCSFHLCIL